jgi:hypothetical protein
MGLTLSPTLKIKRDFKMKLFALNINSGRGGNRVVTRKAYLIDCNCTGARVFYLFYLIGSWFTQPFIGDLIIENNIPNTFLTRLVFILFAGNYTNEYNGNGNDKFFHNG